MKTHLKEISNTLRDLIDKVVDETEEARLTIDDDEEEYAELANQLGLTSAETLDFVFDTSFLLSDESIVVNESANTNDLSLNESANTNDMSLNLQSSFETSPPKTQFVLGKRKKLVQTPGNSFVDMSTTYCPKKLTKSPKTDTPANLKSCMLCSHQFYSDCKQQNNLYLSCKY